MTDRRIIGYGVMAFAIGAGVMAIEITASRMLAPYFGTSMLVWTSLILSVLTALSFGYWIGGNIASSKAAEPVVGGLLAASAATLLAGTLLVRATATSLLDVLHGFSAAMAGLFVGSLAVAMVAFAVPVFLLAVASPMVVKLWTIADQDAGRAAGRYFAASTFGSMVGTVLPTLVLVPLMGSRATLAVTAAMLAVSALPALRGKARIAAMIAMPVLIFAAAFAPVRAQQGVIAQKESPHQLIRVMDDGAGMRSMTFNEGTGIQSMTIPESGLTGQYYDHFAALPFLLGDRAEDHDAVVLGLAGGTAIRQYLALLGPENRVRLTGVEVDPAVVDIARAHFDLDGLRPRLTVVEQDARTFLRGTDAMFDAVMIDAYAVQLYIPAHLVTEEFFALVRSRLRDGGFLAMNVNASRRDAPLLAGITNTIAKAFPYVATIDVRSGSWNYMVIASDHALPFAGIGRRLGSTAFSDVGAAWSERAERVPPHDAGRLSFTDDAAPVEFLTENMVMGALIR